MMKSEFNQSIVEEKSFPEILVFIKKRINDYKIEDCTFDSVQKKLNKYSDLNLCKLFLINIDLSNSIK